MVPQGRSVPARSAALQRLRGLAVGGLCSCFVIEKCVLTRDSAYMLRFLIWRVYGSD